MFYNVIYEKINIKIKEVEHFFYKILLKIYLNMMLSKYF